MTLDLFETVDIRAWLQAVVDERAASGDPLALDELLAVAGLSGPHLSNLLSGVRRLSVELAPGLAMGARLDMHAAEHLLLLTRYGLARTPDEAEVLLKLILESRDQRRDLVARGLNLPASEIPHAVVDALRYALPVLRWRATLPESPVAIKPCLRPPLSVKLIRAALDADPGLPPAPQRWLPGPRDPLGQRLHALGLRRLSWSVPRLGRGEAQTLDVTATVPSCCWDRFQEGLRGALERSLAPVLERDEPGARVVMWVGAQIQPLCQVMLGRGLGPPEGWGKAPAAGVGALSPLRYDAALPWLRDVVAARLARNPHLTQSDLAERLGVNAANLASALRGVRYLPQGLALPLGPILKLSPVEVEGARLLLELQRVRRPDTRARLLERLAELRSAEGVVDPSSENFLAFTRWEHRATLMMADCAGFRADPAWIAGALRPPIPEERAADALARLGRLGLLVPGAGGRLRPSGASFAVPEHLRAEAYVQHYLRTSEIALRALGRPQDPGVSDGCLVSVPRARVDEVLRALRLVQAEMVELFQDAARQFPADQVVYLLLHGSPYALPCALPVQPAPPPPDPP